MFLENLKQKFVLKSFAVSLTLIIVGSLVLGARPYDPNHIPLFTSGRAFSLAILVFWGAAYLPALLFGSWILTYFMVSPSIEYSLHFTLAAGLAMLASAYLMRIIIGFKNPADDEKDWIKYLIIVIPFYLLTKQCLDLGIGFIMHGFSGLAVWKIYFLRSSIDGLSLIVGGPFFFWLIKSLSDDFFSVGRSRHWILLMVGNFFGLSVFFNPLNYFGFSFETPEYLLVIALFGLAILLGPAAASFSLFFQSICIAWSREGMNTTHKSLESLLVDELRLFLLILGIAVPMVSLVLRRKSNQKEGELNQLLAAGISHDLDEPLRNVVQSLSMIEQKIESEKNNETKPFLDMALMAAKRARKIAKSTLEMARVDRQELKLEVFNCEEMVRECVASFSSKLDALGAEIDIQNLPTALGDKNQLARVIENLLSNAIKYRSEKKLKITVFAKELRKYECIAIRDNGIGFDVKHAHSIFDLYSRLHTFNEIEGYGIGLALCKRIIELHDGHIWTESFPNEGSTFFFTLPKVKRG